MSDHNLTVVFLSLGLERGSGEFQVQVKSDGFQVCGMRVAGRVSGKKFESIILSVILQADRIKTPRWNIGGIMSRLSRIFSKDPQRMLAESPFDNQRSSIVHWSDSALNAGGNHPCHG